MKKILTIACIVAGLPLAAQPHSVRVAATIMQTWKDSFALDGKPAKWTYDMGVILKGMEGLWLNTGNAAYFDYIRRQMDFFVNEDGSIKTYKPEEFNIDHVNNGKLLLVLYEVTLKDKYLKAAKLLRQQLQNHPRTQQGSFWHKKIYPNQVWLDGLYMAQPFYAAWAKLAHEDSVFDDVARQFVWIENHARDHGTGLLYHAWDESRAQQWADPQTGTSPLFWARAMGWYATALVDALDHFPAGHPGRQQLTGILGRLAKALQRQQHPATGLWYDVLAYNGPDKDKNYFEASASCQFVYAIAKGVRMGYLPAAMLPVAKKGYAGILKQFVKEADGQTNLHGTVKVSGLGGKPYRNGSFGYYMSEPVIANDPKGMGAFLLAANEMDMLPTLDMGRGKKVMMDNYFNRETKQDAFGKTQVFHYKWWERDNGGFHFLHHVLTKHGATTALLNEAPTAGNLSGAAAYFLIDPDWPKENKQPNYIQPQHIEALYRYVQKGGVLVLLANDSNNVEFENFNKLAARFGIRFIQNMRHDVINNQFEQGAIVPDAANPLFGKVKKVFIKQLCTQAIKRPATAIHTENGEVLMSLARVGKGTVLAIGDPWFYNEYVDGRKLPAEYENYKAAEALVQWLLKQAKN
jgi:unsaturated rhamnogalacturonyl hydrolase